MRSVPKARPIRVGRRGDKPEIDNTIKEKVCHSVREWMSGTGFLAEIQLLEARTEGNYMGLVVE